MQKRGMLQGYGAARMSFAAGFAAMLAALLTTHGACTPRQDQSAKPNADLATGGAAPPGPARPTSNAPGSGELAGGLASGATAPGTATGATSAGTGGGGTGGGSTGAPSASAADAKAIFAQRCTLCHGMAGKGDGPASATLSPKPRNYTDPAWQASVQDDYLRKAIVEGGAAVGKSMMMPPNPDLQERPEIVTELVKIIRGFKK